MSHIVLLNAPPSGWDEEIASVAGATPFQTTAWAVYAAAYLGEESLFFRVVREGRPRAWLLVQIRSPFHSRLVDRRLATPFLRIARRLFPSGAFLRGPLFSADANADDAAEIADAMQGIARANRRLDGTLAIHGPDMPRPLFIGEIEHRGWAGPSEATLVVDLARDEDEIWRTFKPSARKDISRAERSGIRVRFLKERSELRGFSDLLRDSRRRLGLRTFSARNLEAMWDHLRPVVALNFVVAEHGGDVVAGLGVWCYGGVAIEFASAQSERAVSERLYASDLVKWHALRWARSAGARYFDLAGIVLSPGTSKEAGIRQFKEKWGGQLTTAPLVELRGS